MTRSAKTGSPATSVTAGSSYSFRPTASDPDGNTLGFSITGLLSGTPTSSNVGAYQNVIINVSDGKVSVALPAFAIAVKAASGTPANGAAPLSWTPPTTNTDGSSLTNLSGYRIYYGTSSTTLSQTIQVSNASISTYVVENLSPATYYFAVKAVTLTGAESVPSNIASKTVQ